jgi:hypothetical protein
MVGLSVENTINSVGFIFWAGIWIFLMSRGVKKMQFGNESQNQFVFYRPLSGLSGFFLFLCSLNLEPAPLKPFGF